VLQNDVRLPMRTAAWLWHRDNSRCEQRTFMESDRCRDVKLRRGVLRGGRVHNVVNVSDIRLLRQL